jgi:serine/threonine protein kinase
MEHNGTYKIIDFGFSKKLEITSEKDQVKGTTLGTVTTMAPEVFKRAHYGLKVIVKISRLTFGQLESYSFK